MHTIEELIKQAKFKDEKHKAIVSVIYASNLLANFHEDFFRRFQITTQQFNALRILRGQYPNPSKVSLVRERMLDKMSDASRIVERLRKRGLVQRVVSATDRRSVDILITQKGMNVLLEIEKNEKDLFKPTAKFTDAEAHQLSTLMEKLLNGILE